jgi:hypothetical protein
MKKRQMSLIYEAKWSALGGRRIGEILEEKKIKD